MPLQIRRGPTADRLAITPLLGELVYDTTTSTVYVGDGVTPGGIAATNFTEEDAKVATARTFLGTLLNDNSIHNGISFTWNGTRLSATISDNFDGVFKGSFFAEDSGIIIDGESHTLYGSLIGSVFGEDSSGPLVNAQDGSINLDGTIKGNVIPDTTEAYDLGSPTRRFKDLYLSGTTINLGGAVISSPNGLFVNLPASTTVGGNTILVTSEFPQVIDINGSVFADDSTGPLVDAVEGSINLNGTIKDDIIPDETESRNLGSFATKFNKLYLTESADALYIGNAAIGSVGSVINLPAGSTVDGVPIGSGGGGGDGVVAGSNYNINIVADDSTLIVNSFSKQFNGEFFGNITGNVLGGVTGNVLGNVTGNLTGNVLGDVTGTVTGSLIGPVLTPSQANITEIGTLDFLAVEGTITCSSDVNADRVFADDFYGTFYGSVVASNSTVLVDATNGRIAAENIVGTFTGDVVGNVKGSVFSDDSSKIVDGVESKIYAPGGVYADIKNNNEDLILNVATKTASLTSATANSFFIGSAGSITNPTGTLMLVDVGSTTFFKGSVDLSTPLVSILTADSTGVDANSFVVTRQRGSLISPSAVQVGDEFGNFEYSGFDGSAYQLAGGLKGVVDNAVSAGVVPSRIDIFVNNSTGGAVTPVSVKATQVSFAVPPTLPVVADDSARTALVPTPATGMMIFMSLGTTPAATNKVQVFDGSNWVNLH